MESLLKRLDIVDIHNTLLNIAKEFSAICEHHSIPYYMLGGTMLGAIRHKGFIPWDDDMDFGVPREYYQRLLKVLKTELSEPYKVHYLEDKRIKSAWIKIDDTNTAIDDPRINLPIEEQLGINIDVFPMDFCSLESYRNMKVCRVLQKIQSAIFVDNSNGNKTKNGLKHIVRCFVPFNKNYLLKIIDKRVKYMKGDDYLGVFYGLGGERDMCVPKEWYGDKHFKFEDTTFRGVEQYEKYLSQRYGNYMTLPPEEKRHYHCENIYIK